jgi:hypothetical protein
MNMNYSNGSVVLLARGVLFLLLALNHLGLSAADIQFYYIAKSQSWTQTGPANLSRSGRDKYVFSARVIEAVPGSVGSGSVTLPNNQ